MKAAGQLAPVTQRRIFVVCPGGLVTGGPELLHQLVHALREEGRDATIVYHPFRDGWQTPAAYERYGCPVAAQVPDADDCAVVVPEVLTRELYRLKRTRHVVWWLSVDYYLGVRNSIDGWIKALRRPFTSDIPAPESAVHLFQSAYARDFVRARFGVPGFMLSDYIAPDYREPPGAIARRDAVAFNPKKGIEYTRRLMRRCPDIEFVPLQGMTRRAMRDALDASKVYIDFGTHPGKDRIPREAALRGAVVLVARRGAAAHAEDVPIPDADKISLGRRAIPQLEERIRAVFAAYEPRRQAQDGYRAAIANEPALFREQVRAAFCA